MQLRESVRISWRAITGHKLRSALTTLGVIIGVGSVIVFMVMGGGFMADVTADVEEDREPTLSVQVQSSASTGFGWQLIDSPMFTETDVDRLRELDGVDYVAPDGWLTAVQLSHGSDHITGEFTVRSTAAPKLEQQGLVDGRAFEGDGEVVLNREARQAFDRNVTIGEEVSLTMSTGSSLNGTVTGVVDDGTSGINGSPTVYVPVEHNYPVTIETPRGTEEQAYPFLEIGTESLAVREDVKDRARSLLRDESDAAALKDDGQEIRVLTREDKLERFEDVIDQITLFVGGIAALSLLVGSIGIANIMIVSVTERTREIGIMKAVGAGKGDLVQLFLVEATILGALGAVLGVAVGLGGGYLAVTLFGWPMAYPVDWILIAVIVGVTVGVLSGGYPAWRAARVDPIQALRRE